MIHLDCAQSFCKIPIKIGKTGIDFATISGHKIHGPKGSSVLYVKSDAKLKPFIHGGGQQDGFRGGTPCLAAVKGLTEASKLGLDRLSSHLLYVTNLKQTLIKKIKSSGIAFILNSNDNCSPYIVNMTLPGVKAQPLIHTLEIKDIFISSVSACSSKNIKASHVLTAMGIPKNSAESSIRISFCRYNTLDEVNNFVDELVKAIKYINP